jgi:hypothetical protein
MLAVALGAVSLSLPEVADAHYTGYRHHHRRHYAHTNNSCDARRHRRRVNGAIIGSIGGAVVGNSLARGNRTGGTLLGAGVGALAGNEIGKNSTRC